MPDTRRSFLTRVAHAGGYSAAFTTMQHMGLLPALASAPDIVMVAERTGQNIAEVAAIE